METRTDKSIRNVKFALAAQAVSLVISFVTRRIFVLFLSTDYLGLSGLFSSILSMLSLAELGVGAAITFSLYKPLAEGDEMRLAALMKLYKRCYTIIGLAVLAIGAALTPLLPYIIKDMPDIPNLNIIYLLFVCQSAASYFFGYRQAIIFADQKRYIVSLCSCLCITVQHILQIVVLYLTHSYIAYLLVYIACTLLNNLILWHRAGKDYPFLHRAHSTPTLEAEDRLTIARNVKAMIAHKVGGVIVYGTDNLLITKLVGLAAVGLYSNYLMITQMLQTVYGLLFQSVTASVGNLGADQERGSGRLLEIFDRLNFFGAWLYGFSAACLVALLNPVITVWLGPQFCFPMSTVLLISANFYVTGMRQACLTFRESLGLYWFDRYKPWFESAINLGVSIWLGIIWGVDGILIGTFVSTMTTCFWIEPWMLYKHGFHHSVWKYFMRYGVYALLAAVATALSFLACARITAAGIGALALRFAICAVLPNLVYWLAFHRREEYRFFVRLIRERMFGRTN